MTETMFTMGGLCVALIGAMTDVTSARIPNWLTYTSAATALILRTYFLGFSGLKSGAVGMLVAGGLFLFLFFLGAMGGGDMKLMAAVGMWVGSAQVVLLLIMSALAGGALALASIIKHRVVGETLRNTTELLSGILTIGPHPHPLLNVQAPGSRRVPFGVATAMGTLSCACIAMWWR